MPTRAPVDAIRLAAGTRIRKPTPANASPMANLVGVDGSRFAFFNFIHNQANTGERRMINIAFTLCHQVDGNDQPKTELFVFSSANKVNVEPACSKDDQNNAAAK